MIFKIYLAAMLALLITTGCTSKQPIPDEIPIIEPTEYQTIISVEDEILATPIIFKYSEEHGIFIYDEALGKVLQLNKKGKKIQEFGQRGRGPGEFQRVNNFFLFGDFLYATDRWKYAIHQFRLNGELASTMSYGDLESKVGTPPPPPPPSLVRAMEINNQPFITQNGNVFISALSIEESVESLYAIYNWESEKLGDIGEIPEGSTFILDNEKIREDVQNRVVPTYYRSKAFPVNDISKTDEFFMVYTALPRLAKYDDSGEKVWEVDIPNIPEIDSVTNHFYPAMERMQKSDIRNRIILEYYSSGVSSPNGHLFLAMNRKLLWIHEFNPEGELIRRYKFSSPDVSLTPVFDIDFDNRRFLVVTEEGEIRAYPF